MLTIVVAIDSIEINAIENIDKVNASAAIETIDATSKFKAIDANEAIYALGQSRRSGRSRRSKLDAIVACKGPRPSGRSRPTTITRSFRTMWARRSVQ